MKDQTTSYVELRNEIDVKIQALANEHSGHMMCRKGCSMCCLDFEVFPVEFEAIKNQVKEEYPAVLSIARDEQEEGTCAFLQQHACTIYNARPIICRTHGFPLLNMNEDGDAWELSHCELNFNEVDEDYFEDTTLYEQDTFNSKLFMLNKRYLADRPHLNYGEFDLVPLKNLLL